MLIQQFVQQILLTPYLDCGRDWAGIDCYGLYWLAWKEVWRTSLPVWDGDYSSADDISAAKCILRGIEDYDRISQPKTSDAVIFTRDTRWHIGLMIGSCEFVHAQPGIFPRVESTFGLTTAGRYEGFYRPKVELLQPERSLSNAAQYYGPPSETPAFVGDGPPAIHPPG